MTTSPLFKKLKTHTVVAICATIGLFSSTSAMAICLMVQIIFIKVSK